MFKLPGQLNKLYALDIVSFVAIGNHFHALVRAPGDLPLVEEWKKAFPIRIPLAKHVLGVIVRLHFRRCRLFQAPHGGKIVNRVRSGRKQP